MLLRVRHRVADFNRWKVVYDEHAAVRKEHGATRCTVTRNLDDPNDVTVVTWFPDRASADAFAADPSLPEAMGRAGVEGTPDITFLDLVEEVEL
jgi:hypothetical protein